MFGRPISRRGWLLLTAAVVGCAILAGGRGGPTGIQYPNPTYVGSSPGLTPAQVLAIGAAQRQIAREMDVNTMRQNEEYERSLHLGQ